ncbi:AAA domain-containing protein [Sulfurihydrogenibium sp.]|jgi:superfamily I DNA and/or RNA helicase|uniref:AAA domain-containing protein n=1 Tax=Sulfurihydrogenibium sp. TaxID=2053621 RepID=UPI00261DD2F3|nr:AAA domain-containing protein [Sulfurihydrogenibium sp.]
MQDCKEKVKNILSYYLFSEMFQLEQEDFKPNFEKIFNPESFKNTIVECRGQPKDKRKIDAFKVYVGVCRVKDFIKHLQDIGLLEEDENLEKFKLNSYIALGYFYITKNGHLIYSNERAIKYLPILPIIRIFKNTKDISEAIKEYVEKQEDIEKLDNKAFLDRWKVDKDEPNVCYVIDSSWVVDEDTKEEDIKKLKNLKNCVLCVTKQIISELDRLKKSSNRDKSKKAREFRRVIYEMAKEAKKNQDGRLRDGMWYPSKEKKQIFIIRPSYKDLDESEYGVDSSADASVIKATVDMSSKYFPIVLTKDMTIESGIQEHTTCFGVSMSLDMRISDRRLVDLKSSNSIDALKEEEEFFFKLFEIEEKFLETSRKALSSFGNCYFKGTAIAMEPVLSGSDKASGYQRALEDLQNISLNPIFESVQELLEEEKTSELLNTYLCGKDMEFDLSSVKTVVELLTKQDIPLAKWLSPYNASMMQQIAINKANELKDQELMAVNGPPGTGKTTLLKDIIANIIVKRALKIIDADYKIFDNNGKLIDDLKGFGIVVASNNNAAVENISIEMPKMDDDVKNSLIDINEDGFRYFEDLIRKYFEEISKNQKHSKTKNNEDIDEDLGIEDIEEAKKSEYFGLLSIPLGKLENRDKAKRLLGVLKTDIDQEEIPSKEDIREIGDKIKNLKSKIEELSKKHKNYYAYLTDIENLQKEKDQIETDIKTLENELSNLTKEKEYVVAEILKLEEKKKETINLLDMHEKSRPSEFANFLSIFLKAYKTKIEKWETQKQNLMNERTILNQRLDEKEQYKEKLQNNINDIQSSLSEKKAKKDNIDKEFSVKLNFIQDMESNYKDMLLPKDLYKKILSGNQLTEDEKKQIYMFTPYNYNELNKLRMQIFIESLKLHKLLIAKHKEEFKKILNIFTAFLSIPDKFTNDTYSMEDLFNAFFFVIPVTSTTFHSFGTLFKNMRKAGIGYLIVDEAGQATPQQALMPLYKSNKAIVVGDPLQIEPVVSITSDLDNYLIKSFNIEDPKRYQITSSSVQIPADHGSSIGAFYEDYRVGIPLNIHRRCNNPMFKIANEIAYKGRMIKGQQHDKESVKNLIPDYIKGKPQSLWIHVDWEKSEKKGQVVLDEIEALRKLLRDIESRLSQHDIDIKEFIKSKNLFIITPFKDIKEHIEKEFKESSSKLENALVNESLGKFIGTIHTFQGKEAKIVIIVLGGEEEKSMNWVASKPNMLNVALTRAKEYCFIIGDRGIWSNKPYFKEAVKYMNYIESKKLWDSDPSSKPLTINTI